MGGEARLELRPAGAVPLLAEVRIGDAGLLQEQGVELGSMGPMEMYLPSAQR